MKKLILFISLVSITNIFASSDSCSIGLFSKVYRLEPNSFLGNSDIIQTSDCENFISNKITQMLSSSNGSMGAEFLKKELEKDYPAMKITISPRKITLLDLNTTLREELTANSNLFFLDSKSLNGLHSLSLTEGEQIKINCENCQSFGEKNIKIDINNPLSNGNRALWFTSRIMAKIKIFKAKRNLSFQQKHLEADDFYADEIFTGNPENLVTSLDNIHFYKTNKTILQGVAVSNLDLQAVNLVSFGIPVQVVLKNQNINLQRTALPNRSALFGEVVELKNPNNNKIIAGKVIDYNKVVIEL